MLEEREYITSKIRRNFDKAMKKKKIRFRYFRLKGCDNLFRRLRKNVNLIEKSNVESKLGKMVMGLNKTQKRFNECSMNLDKLHGSYEQQENLEYEPIIDEHKDEVNRKR
jgi:hypothetical protein